MSYLWSIVVQAWFFSTPIVYPPVARARSSWQSYPSLLRIYNDLPMAVIVRIYRNLLYDLRMPRLIDFGMLSGMRSSALLIGWWIFDRFEGRFAEEL